MNKAFILVSAAALSISLVGCGTSQNSPQSSPASGHYPVTVDSCGEKITFNEAPKNVLMLSEMDGSILYDLGVLDHVTKRAGNDKISGEAPDYEKALQAIPKMESGSVDSGGAAVSTEAVLDANADLVLGYDSGADRKGLNEAGIPLYSPPALCANYSIEKADWSLVDKEIDTIAAIFGVDEATVTKVKQANKAKVDALSTTESTTASAAALYVTPGSSEFYAYGTSSMVQPIFEANGLINSYADESTRVFDASMEDLLKRDPEWIVLLTESADAQTAIDTLKSFPGADGLQAVKKGQVIRIPFVLTDPPSTLSVQGAVELGKALTK